MIETLLGGLLGGFRRPLRLGTGLQPVVLWRAGGQYGVDDLLQVTLGDGAVIDWQFNTTDVLILLPVSRINPKYLAYYDAPALASKSSNRGEVENVIGGR